MKHLLRILITVLIFYKTNAYFVKNGHCPQNIKLQEQFRLSNFYGKWYQTHHYSSDGLNNNNCSTIELVTEKTGIYLNQSRVDRGLFHRYSMLKIEIPTKIEDAAYLNVVFYDKNAPRRLVTRKYPFHVLSTNYNYYATVYTCQYSPLTNKHYIYIWILSRNKILNDVSKELAIKPLHQLHITAGDLIKDDLSTEKCSPKYYYAENTEPKTFNTPVPI